MAVTVDNSAYSTKFTAFKTKLDAVTSTKYGSIATIVSSTATAITEASVSWNAKPSTTVSTDYKKVTISGSTKETAYVYCAW